jgi:hypothetical protein
MTSSSDHKEPVVERSPGDEPDDPTRSACAFVSKNCLPNSACSPFRVRAHTARITAEGLKAEYCKVMEYLPTENRLLIRAGVGWDEGVVGHATIGADLASPAGYALRAGKPVIWKMSNGSALQNY